MHPFREAVETRDEQALEALLADDVVFTSPVAFRPYAGKAITAAILRGVLRVLEDFRYVREIGASDGRDHALVFTATVAGKAITAAILRGVLRVLEDFRYVREIGASDGRDHALVFTATVAGKQIQGCDFLHVDDDGKIDDFVVMVRPLSAATALAEAMGAQFERISREAAGR